LHRLTSDGAESGQHLVSTRICEGQHLVSTYSALGQQLVNTWSALGQPLGSALIQHLVNSWSTVGQHLVSTRSATWVSAYSALGQQLVNTWSALGQPLGSALGSAHRPLGGQRVVLNQMFPMGASKGVVAWLAGQTSSAALKARGLRQALRFAVELQVVSHRRCWAGLELCIGRLALDGLPALVLCLSGEGPDVGPGALVVVAEAGLLLEPGEAAAGARVGGAP
jgi:Flp pilus assembly pilin Flp